MAKSNQEILDQAQEALFQIISGAQSYTINGRQFTSANLDSVRALIKEYEERVAASSQPGLGGGTILVKFNDAR